MITEKRWLVTVFASILYHCQNFLLMLMKATAIMELWTQLVVINYKSASYRMMTPKWNKKFDNTYFLIYIYKVIFHQWNWKYTGRYIGTLNPRICFVGHQSVLSGLLNFNIMDLLRRLFSCLTYVWPRLIGIKQSRNTFNE